MDWKGWVILALAVLAIIGAIWAGVNIWKLLTDNLNISGELERYKGLYGETRKAKQLADERVGVLETQLKAALGTVGDLKGTASDIVDNQRRIEATTVDSWREINGLRGLIRHIDEGLQGNNL